MSAAAGTTSSADRRAGLAERRWALATVAVLAVVVIALYGRALDAPFVFDDRPGILENDSITRLWPLVGDDAERGPLNPPPFAPTARRPLANLTFAIDYHFHALRPAGYRAVNLLLHVLTAALLAALVRRTLALPGLADVPSRARGPLGLVAALVFAVHPLASEAVVYLTQRTELLAACCYLATLWAALRHWTASTPTRAAAWAAAAIVLCLAGMASKEVMASAPLVVWLYERTFLVGSWRATHRSRRLYVGLALAWVLMVALNAQGASGLSDARHYVPPPVWWVTQAKVLLLYLKLTVWPWPLALHYAPVYLQTVAAAWPWVLGCLAVALATAALVWRRPAARFLVLAAVLVLAPTLVIPLAKMVAAERRMYLPLTALVTLAVVGGYRMSAARAPGGADRRMLGVAVLVVATLATVTWHRLAAWATAITIWEDTVRTQPDDAMAHYNLGVALIEAGRSPAEAMPPLAEALRLDPAHTGALDNLGLLARRLGRPAEAMQRFEQALALEPDDAVAHNNLGAVLLDLGRPQEALPHLEQALVLQPDRPKLEVHLNLGKALLETGHADAALTHLETAVRLQPDAADAHYNLGSALLVLGRPRDALPSFEAALRLSPDDAEVENNLASALLQTGQIEPAIAHLRHVLARRPDKVAARNNLGTALRTLGQTAEAIEQFTRVLDVEPTHATAQYNLGSALLDSGRPDEAIVHFEAALKSQPDDAQMRFQCAIAYRHAHRDADALAMADSALATARAHGQTALAADIETWVAQFRR